MTADRPATEPRTEAGPTTPMEALKELTEAAGVMLAAEDYQSANERRLLRAAVAAQAFIEAEAAQGAAPPPHHPNVPGKQHVLPKPTQPRPKPAPPPPGAAPRAEGPGRSLIKQAIDEWYEEDHPGIDEIEWRDGLLESIVARLSRPSDERVPESEECKRFRHDEHCDHWTD